MWYISVCFRNIWDVVVEKYYRMLSSVVMSNAKNIVFSLLILIIYNKEFILFYNLALISVNYNNRSVGIRRKYKMFIVENLY